MGIIPWCTNLAGQGWVHDNISFSGMQVEMPKMVYISLTEFANGIIMKFYDNFFQHINFIDFY